MKKKHIIAASEPFIMGFDGLVAIEFLARNFGNCSPGGEFGFIHLLAAV